MTHRRVHRSTYTLRLSVSDICLSRTSCLSREQRHRKTKIGTEVAHVTGDSDITFKVKGQGHRATLINAVFARQAAAAMGVRTCWTWETAAMLPSAQPREEFRRLQLVYINSVRGKNRLWGETSMGRNVLPWGEVSMGRKVMTPSTCIGSHILPVLPQHIPTFFTPTFYTYSVPCSRI